MMLVEYPGPQIILVIEARPFNKLIINSLVLITDVPLAVKKNLLSLAIRLSHTFNPHTSAIPAAFFSRV
jgi:hypothetical protein